MFGLNKKSKDIQKNDYDITLGVMLNDYYISSIVSDIRKYAKDIYTKQKSLLIYPEGEDRDMALARIESIQQCLQIAIREYNEWREKVIQYITDNATRFEYYHDFETGERMYPPTAYQIIDNTVSKIN